MKYEARVPETADGAQEVTIKRWLYQPGDRVAEGADMVEAVTEKITLYIPAPADGILSEIMVPEGTAVHVGTVVGIVEGA